MLLSMSRRFYQMPTLHIGPAVPGKTGMVIKGFSFIVLGDLGLFPNIVIEHFVKPRD